MEAQTHHIIKQGQRMMIKGLFGRWREVYAREAFNLDEVDILPLMIVRDGSYYDFSPMKERVKIKTVVDGKEIVIKDDKSFCDN